MRFFYPLHAEPYSRCGPLRWAAGIKLQAACVSSPSTGLMLHSSRHAHQSLGAAWGRYQDSMVIRQDVTPSPVCAATVCALQPPVADNGGFHLVYLTRLDAAQSLTTQ